MTEARKDLKGILSEYEKLTNDLVKEVVPDEGTTPKRSIPLLDQDKNCSVLVGKLTAVDTLLQRKFNRAVPGSGVATRGAASSEGFVVSKNTREVQKDLLEAQQCMEQAIFHAQKQLDAIQQSERGAMRADHLIKFAHRISQANAVAAPVGWGPGDPRRPYPSDLEMRIGSLGSLGAPSMSGVASSGASSTGNNVSASKSADTTTGGGESIAGPAGVPMDTQANGAGPSTTTTATAADTFNAPAGAMAAAVAAAAAAPPPTGSSSPAAMPQWHFTNFNDGDLSSDSSDGSSPPRSHPSSQPPVNLNAGLCNGDELSTAADSSLSARAPSGAPAGTLSADSSSSSSSSDDND